MARDTEQRVIAYSMLVLAGVTVVGWFAWVVTAARPAGIVSLVVVGAMLATLLSIPASVLGIVVYDRSARDWTTVARLVALALVVGVALATVSLFLFGTSPAVLVVGTALSVLSAWALVPLAIGAIGAAGNRVTIYGVLLAWPPSALLAMALFLAPGSGGIDFATGNAVDLAEPLRSLVLLVVVALVTFGPVMLGRLMDRLITVRVEDVPA